MLSVMSGTQLEDLISLVVIVQFEELILAILPTVCFLFLTPFRAIRLARRKIKVRRNALYIAKLVSRLRGVLNLMVVDLITDNDRSLHGSTTCTSDFMD